MKKLLILIFALCGALSASAQNLQLHYDFGRDIYPDEEAGRQKVTATFEQFKADNLGSWFYFIDMDLNRKGVIGAYAELSREFNIQKDSPFAAHIEYNGGLDSHGIVFQPAALLGGAWNVHNADFSTTASLQLLYKQYFNGQSNAAYASMQLTGVWSRTFLSRKMTFAGYIDLWRGQKSNGHGQLIMMAEPQLWYNITPQLSLGTEFEVSNNFIYNTATSKTFFINPTLAVKFQL